MRSIKNAGNLNGKRVIVRVDFNEPLETVNNKIQLGDDLRIKRSLATIKYLIKKKAIVILLAHLGEPSDGVDPKLSLQVVVDRLADLLKRKSISMDDTILDSDNKKLQFSFNKLWLLPAKKGVYDILKPGDIVLLDNIRFFKEEKENSIKFAKFLASLGDLYINEAFSVSHRKHASVVGISKYLSSYVGFELAQEVKVLTRLIDGTAKRPFVLVLGGAKVADKILIIKNLIKRVDYILLGGVMANTFLAALKYNMGKTRIDNDSIVEARQLLHKYGDKIILPTDVVVSDAPCLSKSEAIGYKQQSSTVVAPCLSKSEAIGYKQQSFRAQNNGAVRTINLQTDKISIDDLIYDLGPDTITLYISILVKAHTIAWNGPVGFFENKNFRIGTMRLARKLCALAVSKKIFVVAGGGETVDAIKQLPKSKHLDYLSIGGGAMLDFLSGTVLPGIRALDKNNQ